MILCVSNLLAAARNLKSAIGEVVGTIHDMTVEQDTPLIIENAVLRIGPQLRVRPKLTIL